MGIGLNLAMGAARGAVGAAKLGAYVVKSGSPVFSNTANEYGRMKSFIGGSSSRSGSSGPSGSPGGSGSIDIAPIVSSLDGIGKILNNVSKGIQANTTALDTIKSRSIAMDNNLEYSVELIGEQNETLKKIEEKIGGEKKEGGGLGKMLLLAGGALIAVIAKLKDSFSGIISSVGGLAAKLAGFALPSVAQILSKVGIPGTPSGSIPKPTPTGGTPTTKKPPSSTSKPGMLSRAGGALKNAGGAALRFLNPATKIAAAGAAGYGIGTFLNEKFDLSTKLVDMISPSYDPNADVSPVYSGKIDRSGKDNPAPKQEIKETKKEDSGVSNSIKSVGDVVSSVPQRIDRVVESVKSLPDTLEKLFEKMNASFKKTMEETTKKGSNLAQRAKYAASGTYKNITVDSATQSRNQQFAQTLQKTDPYMYKLAMKESSGGKNLFSTTSSAAGMFQFTEGTWNDVKKKMGNDHWTLEDRLDPEKAYAAAKFLDRQNRQHLKGKLGRDVTDKDAYMAHFMGAGGATKFLKGMGADPSQRSGGLASDAAVAANSSIFGSSGEKSAQQVYDQLTSSFSGGATEQTPVMLASGGKTNLERASDRSEQVKAAASAPVVVVPPQIASSGGGGGVSASTTNNYYGNSDADPIIRSISGNVGFARYGMSYGVA